MISREQLERWKEWTEAHAALMGIIGEYPSGDVLYIAAMPALIAEVEEQAKEIARLRAALRKALTVLHAYHDDHPEDFGASAHDALWAVEAALKEKA